MRVWLLHARLATLNTHMGQASSLASTWLTEEPLRSLRTLRAFAAVGCVGVNRVTPRIATIPHQLAVPSSLLLCAQGLRCSEWCLQPQRNPMHAQLHGRCQTQVCVFSGKPAAWGVVLSVTVDKLSQSICNKARL